MKFKKSPLAICLKENESTYIIGYGTKQTSVDKTNFEKISLILGFLEREKNNTEVLDFLEKSNIEYDFFQNLISRNMITSWEDIFQKANEIDYKNKLYLESIVSNGPFLLEKIKKTTFIILGCGGIGNFMSYSLASYLPHKMVLIDGDIIEKTNLNRQFLFTLNDIGSYKTDALEKELLSRNSDLNIVNIKKFATDSILETIIKDLKQNQDNDSNIFIILSGDNEGIVEEVTKVAVKHKISLLNVGYLNDISVMGPFYIPNVSSCPCCMNMNINLTDDSSIDSSVEKIKEINNTYSAPSSFINNAFASAMATIDILHYLSGNIEKINSLNKRLGIANSNFEKLHLDIKKNDGCVICGTNSIEQEHKSI